MRVIDDLSDDESDEPRLRVLVVEDDPVAIAKLRAVLLHAGVNIVTAASLVDAHTIIADGDEPFDAALIDVNLPDGDGLTIVPRLHRSEPPCACVILTGDHDAGVVRKAVELGVTQFLRKPATANQVRQAIGMAVHRSRTFRSWLARPASSATPPGKRGSYRASVAADSSEEAITVAAEGLPKRAEVVESEATLHPDQPGTWSVSLRFVTPRDDSDKS